MAESLWSSYLLLIGAWGLAVLSPGPNLLATTYTAVAQSRGAGLLVAAGIAVGTCIWALASLLGLGLLFQHAGWLYGLLKLAGGAYLIFLGVRLLRGTGRAGPDAGGGVPLSTRWRCFRRGLTVDLSNPKAAVFFVSLFAVLVPAEAPPWYQGVVVATVTLMAGGWYAAMACLVDLPRIGAGLRQGRRVLDRVGGAIFVVLGLRLVTDR